MTVVGLDVHARQTHAAIVDPVTGEVRVSKLRMAPIEVASFLAGLGPDVLAVCGSSTRRASPRALPRRRSDSRRTDGRAV
jgi:hypothetical protein